MLYFTGHCRQNYVNFYVSGGNIPGFSQLFAYNNYRSPIELSIWMSNRQPNFRADIFAPLAFVTDDLMEL